MKQVWWYSIKPEDTLVIKAASPADVGEAHVFQSIFPPPASTISGAFRTAVLLENEIPFPRYTSGEMDGRPEIKAIGKAGNAAPFNVIGPLFQKGKELFVPVPYNWFADKEELQKGQGNIHIFKSKETQSPLLKTSTGKPLQMAMGNTTGLVTVGGNWVNIQELFSDNPEKKILKTDAFFAREIRTGIALNENRTVRQSHLYSFVHFRLHNDVKIVCGLTEKLPLKPAGTLTLGAEKRVAYYKQIETPEIPEIQGSKIYLALAPVMANKESNDAILATGKTRYIGGWDMKKRFHKDMCGFFPAGSVFAVNINQNCIAI